MTDGRLKILIVILILSLVIETVFAARGGRVGGGARGGLKAKKKDRKNKNNSIAASDRRVHEIFLNLYSDMTSGNWTEKENRTWIYASALMDMSNAYFVRKRKRNSAPINLFGSNIPYKLVLVMFVSLFRSFWFL